MKLTVDSDVDSEATNECQVFLRKCFLAKLLVSKHDDAKYCATSVLFRFQRKYHQTSPKLQILTGFFGVNTF